MEKTFDEALSLRHRDRIAIIFNFQKWSIKNKHSFLFERLMFIIMIFNFFGVEQAFELPSRNTIRLF